MDKRHRKSTVNKEQRERKRRYRQLWKNSLHLHGMSYPVWLEQQLQSAQDERLRLGRICAEDGRRFRAFSDYINDFEIGMRIVERCARGTIAIGTSIPSLSRKDDTEAVVAAVVSLYGILHDAKKRFNEISAWEQEEIRAHNESIKLSNARWEAERKSKLEKQCDESK